MTYPDTEKLKRANEWLQKALDREAAGSDAKMVDRLLDQAVKLETEAFATKA